MTDPITRALLIDLRSLLLKAVDLIERHLVIGKYKTNMVDVGKCDGIAFAGGYDADIITYTDKGDD